MAQPPNMSLFFPIRETAEAESFGQLSFSPWKNNHSSPFSRQSTSSKIENMALNLILSDMRKRMIWECSWKSWWEGGGVADPELRISEAAPSAENRLWKGTKPNERFFWPFFSPVCCWLAAAGQWVGSFEKAGAQMLALVGQCGRGFGHNVEHNVGYVNLQCKLCLATVSWSTSLRRTCLERVKG